ncbi:hypothetical protein BST81_07260 [Leptolyngbya sp. 'hensonii']|uniref:retropepsin-like aspartic protease n=1 Tax=Leptolyngbya sp. 'hensonii' TaxID=1922337 RepID=UPI00094FA178|nr:retropepsin-like aspartic protease [Leptolyngbya sp. 'hensonii']OLP19015.1 hypothetical protein BST81_07260 [Leptolyngbya sp. 'hensonii']
MRVGWLAIAGIALSLPGVALAAPVNTTQLGRQLQEQLSTCMVEKFPSIPKFALDELQALSMQCMFEVVILTPEGKVRQDANDRMAALVKVSGIKIPKPVSRGQAQVALSRLPGSQVFTIRVQTANQGRPFLLDTGASTSLIEKDLAKQLRLRGTPIPDRLMTYMVVGEKCTNLNAAVYPLPELAVETASVKGLSGLGLPKRAIPGQLSGVLGMDFLSNYDVLLDPHIPQLTLLPPSAPTQQGIPLVGKLGVMTVQTRLNNQGPYTLALDTGADQVVLSERVAKRLGLNLKTAKPITVTGFCGSARGKQVQLDQVAIQSHQVKQLAAIVLDAGPLDLLGVDGIIGQNFLNRYRQHWRFGKRDQLGTPAGGSLELSRP